MIYIIYILYTICLIGGVWVLFEFTCQYLSQFGEAPLSINEGKDAIIQIYSDLWLVWLLWLSLCTGHLRSRFCFQVGWIRDGISAIAVTTTLPVKRSKFSEVCQRKGQSLCAFSDLHRFRWRWTWSSWSSLQTSDGSKLGGSKIWPFCLSKFGTTSNPLAQMFVKGSTTNQKASISAACRSSRIWRCLWLFPKYAEITRKDG